MNAARPCLPFQAASRFGGALAPLLGPLIGLGELKGKCPWCGTKVTNVFNASSFDCHECGKRIDAHDRHFIKAA